MNKKELDELGGFVIEECRKDPKYMMTAERIQKAKKVSDDDIKDLAKILARYGKVDNRGWGDLTWHTFTLGVEHR
jgi:hypothetical protein